jgi:uncharacterized protein (TIGR04255 family)
VFSDFRISFGEGAKKLGYKSIEQVIPPQVPLELVAHQATNRFRTEQNKWPLLQIGPGVFTANIVPPYRGWKDFRPTVADGVNLLYQTYPIKEKYFFISHILLRYVNVFTDEHGVTSISQFLRDELGLTAALPNALLRHVNGNLDDVKQSGQISMKLKSPPNASGVVEWSEGAINNKQGVVMQFMVRTDLNRSLNGSGEVLPLLDESRDVINDWFESLISDGIREKLDRQEFVHHGN